MKGFKVQAQLTGTRPLQGADNLVSITAHTQALGREERAVIIDYLGKTGWLLFKEDDIQDEEVPKDDSDFEKKTPSQRLRAVLWVYAKQLGFEDEKAKEYYKTEMEKIIGRHKNKLD